MKQILALTLCLALLAACGGTPVATDPPPTQTPWIVVVTSTPALQEASEASPAATVPSASTPRATATRRAGGATPSPAVTEASVLPATSGVTAEPQIEVNQVPTEAPLTRVMIYPPPSLLDPPQDQPVSWGSTMLLQWTSVGELDEDEYYHVHMERRPMTDGQEWYGDYVFTKESRFLADVPFLAPFHHSTEHGQATVYWWVWVVQKTGEDEDGKPIGMDISPYSEERTMILEPKP